MICSYHNSLLVVLVSMKEREKETDRQIRTRKKQNKQRKEKKNALGQSHLVINGG
jgi:hypothetical protein